MRDRKGHSILSLFNSSSDADERKAVDVHKNINTDENRSAEKNARQRRNSLVQDPKIQSPKTVSQVLNIARMTLSRETGRMQVEGELSGCKEWGIMRHWFFTLKDDSQSLSCFMKSRDAEQMQGMLKDGLKVIATGKLEVTKQSRLQFVVEKVFFEGKGNLAIYFERLRQEMLEQGWFSGEAKKTLPLLPSRIGVVTSKEGAALHDVCKVLREKMPGINILVAPTRVQGDKASVDIAAAIRRLDESQLCDVLIVTRGGGAAEDLFAFNMRAVCHAVYQCKTPVIAGVGHQSDSTLVELVADARAATPSHASQIAVPDLLELKARLNAFERRMRGALQQKLRKQERSLAATRQKLHSPQKNLILANEDLNALQTAFFKAVIQKQEHCAENLTELEKRLAQVSPRHLVAAHKKRLQSAQNRLLKTAPTGNLQTAEVELAHAFERLQATLQILQHTRREKLHVSLSRLHALSPLAVLERGYALVQTAELNVVRQAKQLKIGQTAHIRFQEGSAVVEVKKVETSKS